MIRIPALAVAVAAGAIASACAAGAYAEADRPPESVAGAFIAAAQAQDRQAILKLLDERVSIQFPSQDAREGRGEGQPFVIGYLDGLFYGQRAVSLDGAAGPTGPAMRFLAHDAQSQTRYAIDIEVKGQRVVHVTVERQADQAQNQTMAAVSPL